MGEPHFDHEARNTAEAADAFLRGKEDRRARVSDLDDSLPDNEQTKNFLTDQQKGMNFVQAYLAAQFASIAEESGEPDDFGETRHVHNGVEISYEPGYTGFLSFWDHIDFSDEFRDINTLRVSANIAINSDDSGILQDDPDIEPGSTVSEIAISDLRARHGQPADLFPQIAYYFTDKGILKFKDVSDDQDSPEYKRTGLSLADILLLRKMHRHFSHKSGMMDDLLGPIPDGILKGLEGVNLDPTR